MPPADSADQPKTTIMEAFIVGVVVSAFIAIPACYTWGFNAAKRQFQRDGSAIEQAQRRHREAMKRREQKLDFVHQCVDDLQHAAEGKEVLGFCEREAKRWGL